MLSIPDALVLSFLPGLRPGAALAIARRGAPEVLARPGDHADLLPPAAARALAGGEPRRRAAAEERLAASAGVRLVALGPDYPDWLARSSDPPPLLWTRSALDPAEGGRSLALVGSRAATTEARTLARAMARELAAAGLVVVSGLARGIDGEAHRGALEAGGRTVAVLGSGLDRMYPPEHAALSEALVRDGGALVSERPLGAPPTPDAFPRRNRILAGWGRGVVVIEAARRSGALVTARCALEEGREVMAVPGPPSWPTAAGTNALIRDGAALVRDAADVAAELGVALQPLARPAGDAMERALRPDAPSTLEDLAQRSGLPLPEVLARLCEMELCGRVRRLPGPLFVATS